MEMCSEIHVTVHLCLLGSVEKESGNAGLGCNRATQEYPVGPDLLSLHLVLAQPNFTTTMNSLLLRSNGRIDRYLLF